MLVLEHVVHAPLEHLDASPGTHARSVGAQKARRHLLRTPGGRLLVDARARGQARHAAKGTGQKRPQTALTARFGRDPCGDGERWGVAHVLGVAAVELGDPHAVLVLSEALDTRFGHRLQPPLQRLQHGRRKRGLEADEPVLLLEAHVGFECLRQPAALRLERRAVQPLEHAAQRLVVRKHAPGVGLQGRFAQRQRHELAFLEQEVRA